MHPTVTATNLTRYFGAVVAVDRVSLEVNAGEVFGLVGPNGAGKTTLLQLLAALRDPTSGRATVLGYDVGRDAEALRQRLGYVSQAFTLYGTLSVEENLDFFAAIYDVAATVREQRKTELLAWSRLAPVRQRRAARRSGGMQKKLHLCCALMHELEVLLLDEPTTGVDPVSRLELWEILYDLVGRGLTLVVSTPYMDEAERCHRVALMHQGRLLRCDRPAALKRDVDQAAWELWAPEPERALAAAGVTVFVTTHYMDEAENCHRLGFIYQGRLVAAGSPDTLKARMHAGVMLELECADAFAALRFLRAQPALSRVSLFGRTLHVLVEDAEVAVPLIHQALQAAGLAVARLEPIDFSLEDVFVLLSEQEERHHDLAQA